MAVVRKEDKMVQLQTKVNKGGLLLVEEQNFKLEASRISEEFEKKNLRKPNFSNYTLAVRDAHTFENTKFQILYYN